MWLQEAIVVAVVGSAVELALQREEQRSRVAAATRIRAAMVIQAQFRYNQQEVSVSLHHAAATVQRHHREAERRRQVRELGFAHRTASQSQVDRQLREAAARTAAALVVQRFLRHRRQRLEASALRAAHRAKTDLVVSRTSSMHVAAARIQR